MHPTWIEGARLHRETMGMANAWRGVFYYAPQCIIQIVLELHTI